MIQNIKVISKEQQATNKWAGGTTTQLAIYPESASYKDRDFIWRLSTAIVELEESTFTKLPGFDRYLMVLDGELKLVHNEHNYAVLKQYQQDNFEGAWDTTSYGSARDFNLMVKEGMKGSLKYYKVTCEEPLKIKLDKDDANRFYACYCYKGDISVSVDGREILLEEGELLTIQYQYEDNVDITMQVLAGVASDIITANIFR
ncbi:MAG: HutD family protein [Lutisporaceae bacterium]